jgi:putative ABC transport system permease protein
MFLIYNTVTFSVVQRRPLFGILRCLGVTGEQLFVLIMSEAIALSLVGSLLGLGLGVALGRGLVGLITQTINDLYFVVNVREVIIDPLSLLRGVAFGVLAALLASFVPALEAWRTPPNSSLRRSVLESKMVRLLPYLVAGWAGLGLVGVLFLRWPGGIIPAFIGLFAVLFAFALLTPPVTVWAMRGLAPAAGWLLGVIGRMATRDIVRSLSRTSVAIAALMTAVSVIVGVSIMIGSFRQTVVLWLNDTLQADIYVSPPALTASRVEGEIDPQIVAQLLAWPGVLRGSTARTTDVLVTSLGREVQLVAVSGDVADGQRPYVWLSTPTEPEAVAQMLNGEGVIISEPLLLKEGLTIPPPPLTFATNEGEITLPVVAVFYDYSTDQGMIWMGKGKYSALWDDTAVSTLSLVVEEGTDVEQMVKEMQNGLTGPQEIVIRSNQVLREGSIEIFDRTFAITAALRLLATIVAFIGVLSALLSLQLERAREFGVLRATGMTLGQLWQLTLVQTGLMGLVAGLLAMPTGYLLAWILIYVINVRSFGWTLQMHLEPGYFGQALLVSLTAALLAGLYPAVRLGRMVIALTLRQE